MLSIDFKANKDYKTLMTFFRPLLGLFTLITIIFSISCSNDDFYSFQDQFSADQAVITQFLDDQDITAKKDTIYGLHYRILEEGNDTIPKRSSTISEESDRMNITYSITALGSDAIVLQDTSKTYLFTNIPIGMSILMGYVEENGVIEMFVPSGYGFGQQQLTNLPPNSPIIITVRLNKIIRNEDEQFAYDQHLIEEYLAANNLQASLDTATGLRYILVEPGDGIKPTSNSSVIVNYNGRIMDGHEFDKGSNARFDLRGLISGWKILMPKVAESGKIIMFIPSKYGYGATAQQAIPPHSILRFEVDLVEVPL